ncbi:MAG: phosphate propanoyltransferase [Clostridia bacterium]|nr:phosphate propanoyltransferase [Clostridia bacterium]
MEKKVLVETSARHVHLTQEHIEALFGKGYQLTHKKDLSQPGQYACEERVDITGTKGTIKNVIILGPARPASQVEVSATDARTLGIKAPIRESGDVAGSGACTVSVGDNKVELNEGVIVAKRHIHITPEDAAVFGVKDKETVKVRVEGERALIFDEVVIRVSEKFATAMHIDTDESNAACAAPGTFGVVVD